MLSHYQNNFIDEIKNPVGAQCIILDAKAGSGKTFTLCEGVKYMFGSSLFLAFNKAIATELCTRGLNASTMHSLGMKACGRLRINNYKSNDLLTKGGVEKKHWSLYKRLNSLGRAHLLPIGTSLKTWEDLVEHFDLTLPEKEIETFWTGFQCFFADMFQTANGIDFDDMVSLPIYGNLMVPKYDWVLVDEAQDLNPCRMELVFAAMRQNTRCVFVGDPNQAIYGFTGAMCDSMEQIEKRAIKHGHTVKKMPLSICYRCSVNVIKEAQKIVPDIEWAPNAAEGTVADVDMSELRSKVLPGDFILGRTVAPLVKVCFDLIRCGKRAQVKGKEIGEDLCNMVDRIASRTTVSTVSFINDLNAFRVKEIEKLEAANRELQAEMLSDKCETLLVLCEGADTIYDLKKKIGVVFADTIPGNTIMCSSVHKSKGLEADVVWIINPELLPFPKARKSWQKQQEMNLKYVAITRSKLHLKWVQAK